MKIIKRIAAFVIAISFCFVLMLSPGAHAVGLLGGQSFGAWMLAGLVSFNTVVSALNAPAGDDMKALREWQAHPFSTTNPYYQYPFEPLSMSEAMNLSTIKVDQGVITIDDVVYDELWVSGEGARKLLPNLFDFKTKWAIMSNNAGTLASGTANIMGVPIYNINGKLKSQTYKLNPPNPASIGDSVITFQQYNSGVYRTTVTFGDGTSGSAGRISSPYSAVVESTGSSGGQIYSARVKLYEEYSESTGITIPVHYIDNTDFQFDYVSGIVPAEESDIPENYGLSMKIPHDMLQTFYETYPQYDQEQVVIDIDQDQINIDELTQAIFDMIDSMEDIKAEWTNGEQPEPPAPVDPIENIDQNVEDISQYQADMQQQVDHMHQDVESIHQTQQQQQQTQNQIQQNTSSIDNTLKDATATPGQSDLPSFKFDLRELFPFCIPFDIYRLLTSFDATPQAPHVQLPIVIQSIGFNYTLDLDFSCWDPVAQTLRTAELIVYALGLAWATGKVIKW